MKLKTEIFLFLFATGLTVILVTGSLYYYSAKEAMMLRLANQMESLSETKKLRLEEIIGNKKQEFELVQNRILLKQNLFFYLRDSSSRDKVTRESYRLLIFNTLTRALGDITSFRKMHVADVNGNIITSTDPSFNNKNISSFGCFVRALKNESGFYVSTMGDSISYLCLSGPISYQGNFLGVLIIETETDDLRTISGDYTGLGRTGETTLAQQVSDSVAVYLTPLRFYPRPFFRSMLNAEHPQIMFMALNGEQGFFTNSVDYRDVMVVASCRKIGRTGWGLVTKIDLKEAMEPIKEFKTMSYQIILIAIVVLAIISLVLSYKIVQPINKISETAQKISAGDLAQLVDIRKKNELGNLATSFNNMTESLIQAQKKLEIKIQELDRSNGSLEKFAYIVSHDLKAPLNSIDGLAEIIISENSDKVNDEGRKMFGMMQAKVKQMHELINGILAYSKIDHASESPEKINFEEVMAQVLQNISPPSNVKIELVTKLPVIVFEKILIIQLLQNFITNAIKYNNKEEKIIKIGHTDEGRFFKFFVSDNGMGIEEKYFDKIFDIFATIQAKSSDSTGIGLAIVKKIIENKGGSVFVTSKIREGSTFYFTILK